MSTSLLVTGLVAFVVVLAVIVLLVRKDVLNLGLIVRQVTSGRWLLTVTAGLCMLIAMATDAWIAIKCSSANPAVPLPFPVSTIFSIMTGVFTFYFLKKEQEAASNVDLDKLAELLAKKLGITIPKSDVEPPK